MHVSYFEQCQADSGYCVCRQLSLPSPLFALLHVALPHPNCVTLGQVKIFLRLSFLFYHMHILTLTWQDFYEDYSKGRQIS